MAALEAAAAGVRRLVEVNPDTSFTLVDRDWPETTLAAVPESVAVESLASGEWQSRSD